MFALIFMWTPPHFWTLALFINSDYSKAKVPMLTVTHGKKITRRHIIVYTVLLAPLGIWTALTSIGGPLSLAVAILLNLTFLVGSFAVWRRDEEKAQADGYALEKRVFAFSVLYLFLHFGAFLAEALLRPYGLGGW